MIILYIVFAWLFFNDLRVMSIICFFSCWIYPIITKNLLMIYNDSLNPPYDLQNPLDLHPTSLRLCDGRLFHHRWCPTARETARISWRGNWALKNKWLLVTGNIGNIYDYWWFDVYSHIFYCSIQLGISSSQLTNWYFSRFSEGVGIPPTRTCWGWNLPGAVGFPASCTTRSDVSELSRRDLLPIAKMNFQTLNSDHFLQFFLDEIHERWCNSD